MADSDNGDLDPRQNETEHDDVDDEPLLSFDFDEEPMPHWSEPGSGEKPDGGERPDPPEIDATTLGRSRLFPQLPDDPHLVDTSDTGLMDAVRSDTVPTVSPGTEEELFDTGPLSVEDSTQTIGQTSDTSHASSTDEFFQDEVSTDELFGESLFEDEEVFDEELFDDAPIIGATEGDGGPVFDTGPIREVEVEERDEDRSDEAVGVEKDAAPDKDLEIEEEAFEITDPPAEANSLSRTEDSNELSELVGEPTAELVLDEQTPQLTQEDVEQPAVGVETDSDLASSPEQERLEQEVKPSPRVIELFDTPPSQRIMASADEPQSEPNEQRRDRDGGDWKDFGGPAPHWREGRQDYEDSTSMNEDDRVVTHSSTKSDNQDGAGRSSGRNLPVAIVVGLALAAAFFGLLKVGPWAILIMVLVALGLAALEFFTSAQNLGYRPATLLGLAAVVGLSLGAYHRGYEAYPVVFALLVVTGLCWFLFDVESQHATANFAVTLLGFGWVGGLGSFGALILAQPHGDAILIGAVIGTISYDVGGYVIGSTTGQSKIAPRVSPNKTYEGLIGGMMLSIVVTTLVLNRFPGVYPWSESMMNCFWLGLAIALAAPIGDLAQSMIKRDMGVKDMGTLLPGHGGVFDRFDALLFVLPTTYFVADLVLN
ncbi:MAG: phosphatidate cytidylyltransferase [Acidimicrobiales bacterium]|nr:phosphatidate cytidylyltransferase [Acidimicrobiales bacterium]